MADQTTTVQALKDLYGQFVADRDWERFHSPKNLAMSLAVETAELMEHFLWIDNEASREVLNDPVRRAAVADEIADVAGHIFCLCNSLGLDLSDTIAAKMKKNVVKYPADKYRGRHTLDDKFRGTGGATAK
jgi:NTP pyrophosphatase (non-canonical NTP hydrolase)